MFVRSTIRKHLGALLSLWWRWQQIPRFVTCNPPLKCSFVSVSKHSSSEDCRKLTKLAVISYKTRIPHVPKCQLGGRQQRPTAVNLCCDSRGEESR